MAIKERWKGTRPVALTTSDIVKIAQPVFSSDQRMLAVYLFGSRVLQENSPDSDVDLAFHADSRFTWDDYYQLLGTLTRMLRSDRLDLVWIEAADPIISFEVIKNGKLLYYRDADVLNEFELLVKKRFWDYRIYLEKRDRAPKSSPYFYGL